MEGRKEGGEIVRLDDRRSVLDPAQTVVLWPDRLEVRRARKTVSIPLDAVSSVRFALETAGLSRQAICRVEGAGREIVFGSQRASGPAVFHDNGETFRRLVVALHEALRPRFTEVEFVRGQPRAFRRAIFVLGLVLTAMSLGLVAVFAARGAGPALVLGTVPFALIGIALAAGYRPGHPAHYDPAALIAEFSEPMEPSAQGAGPAA